MHFTKMHGLGNDFIIIDHSDLLHTSIVPELADRHRGIGFDQAILVNNDHFEITFLNADGSHSGGCGNGTRAVAGYFHKQTGQTKFDIKINLPNGTQDTVHAEICDNNIAKIQMPKPLFVANEIPLSNLEIDTQNVPSPCHIGFTGLQVQDRDVDKGFCVNIGNPHIVFTVPISNLNDIDLENIGPKIEHDPLFPERINVEFISVIDRQTIRMRVWERGAGITQACGTGACASVIAARHKGLVDQKCTVVLDGGELEIDYNLDNHNLIMQGSYTFVYEGELL